MRLAVQVCVLGSESARVKKRKRESRRADTRGLVSRREVILEEAIGNREAT